ncbi:hypothetical protein SmJEL517_g00212 [Synchytrium microbalum]|uniref:DNA replication ATP-dependent helicase/nuclease n=1 Tax=Synchytrium microbalum TaxID=1806994 RepID=A0A507CK91_9FUNG|nr:uncharacterized protein SmJEL517_g00212 [Synchytrium microbalum]TPX38233.1 hypothetical protein SmJEL517_g00212 [Synchytrium microbalum]
MSSKQSKSKQSAKENKPDSKDIRSILSANVLIAAPANGLKTKTLAQSSPTKSIPQMWPPPVPKKQSILTSGLTTGTLKPKNDTAVKKPNALSNALVSRAENEIGLHSAASTKPALQAPKPPPPQSTRSIIQTTKQPPQAVKPFQAPPKLLNQVPKASAGLLKSLLEVPKPIEKPPIVKSTENTPTVTKKRASEVDLVESVNKKSKTPVKATSPPRASAPSSLTANPPTAKDKSIYTTPNATKVGVIPSESPNGESPNGACKWSNGYGDAGVAAGDHVVWAMSPALEKIKKGSWSADTSLPLPPATQLPPPLAASPSNRGLIGAFGRRGFKRSLSHDSLTLAAHKRPRPDQWSGSSKSDGLSDVAELVQEAISDVKNHTNRRHSEGANGSKRDDPAALPMSADGDLALSDSKCNGLQLKPRRFGTDASSKANIQAVDNNNCHNSNDKEKSTKTRLEGRGKENISPYAYPETRNHRLVPPPVVETVAVNKQISDDEIFEGELDDEFLASLSIDEVVASAQSAAASAAKLSSISPIRAIAAAKNFRRYLVLEVRESQYIYSGTSKAPEKILRAWDDDRKIDTFIHLREDWLETEARVGDFIHYIGDLELLGGFKYVVNNDKNMIVLHPDVLLSATTVSEAGCTRRAVLQERVRGTDVRSAEPLFGTMLHDLFQEALFRGSFDISRMEADIPRIISRNIDGLWAVNETEVTAQQRLTAALSFYKDWSVKFLVSKPQALLPDHRKGPITRSVAVSKILDIEENVWSPKLGLKGKVDATVTVKIQEGTGPISTRLAPLEVKTGRAFIAPSHLKQTSLYTMLLGDRYEVTVKCGLLYYVKANKAQGEEEMIHVGPAWEETRSLMVQRNRMVSFLTSSDALPEVIKANTCNNCFVRDTCILYHKATENGNSTSFGFPEVFEKKTNHLTNDHTAFFEKWERLISLEEKTSDKFRAEIWNMTSEDRQKAGRAFGRMKLDMAHYSRHAQKHDFSITGRHQYRFLREGRPSLDTTPSLSLINAQISIGDTVVISSEDGLHIGLAIGFATELTPESIVVSLDRPLAGPPRRVRDMGFPFNPESNQEYTGVLNTIAPPDHMLFRIDKDEFSSSMGLVRGHLVTLLGIGDRDTRRRSLIVDLEPPRFSAVPSPSQVAALGVSLNIDQRNAVQRVQSAQDYALILGMPGTGKTTTISILIRTLAAEGKSVLLTSYTHTAVDNVLLKLKQDNVDFVRLGNVDKVHPGVVEYTPNYHGDIKTVAQLDAFYESKLVVATTCLGVSHGMFGKREFDYCIVDEASQLTLPVCLGPLRYAKRFVLVGDHYQLPPLVKHQEARDNGLSVSLFRRLSEAHPSAVTYLEHQYRMCADITLLSNTLVYHHRLRCGTPEVASAILHVPKLVDGMQELHVSQRNVMQQENGLCDGQSCWIQDIIDPKRRVVFVDTDAVPALDSKHGESTQNDTEAVLVKQTVECLIKSGVEETSIGVISPYRSQLKIMAHTLLNHPGVEVHTVDKFQGRDKECVVVSLVRSNPNQNIGDLLRDWRRINVAFTRAKHKVIIFGSKSTLAATDLFNEFFDLVEKQNWVYKLPPKAHELHNIQYAITTPATTPRPLSMAGMSKAHPLIRDILADTSRVETFVPL